MKTTDNLDELFVVVDKNDNIIGHKTRRECHSDKKLIHRAVGVLIFNDKGEVLIQKRSASKDKWPEYFTLSASGHVEKGESYSEAAARELHEEIGVKVNLEFVTKYLHEAVDETEYDSIFKGVFNGPFVPNTEEVEGVEFVSLDRLRDMEDLFTPCAKDSLKQIDLL